MRQRTVYLVFWMMLMVLSIMGFILIDLCTIKPSQISGNGNIAILFTIPTVLFYLLFLFNFVRWFMVVVHDFTLKQRLSLLIILFITFIVLIFLEIDFVRNLTDLLGGGPEDPESRIYQFGWYNQYTNTLFFNWITFCMGIVISTIMAICFRNLKKQLTASIH